MQKLILTITMFAMMCMAASKTDPVTCREQVRHEITFKLSTGAHKHITPPDAFFKVTVDDDYDRMVQGYIIAEHGDGHTHSEVEIVSKVDIPTGKLICFPKTQLSDADSTKLKSAYDEYWDCRRNSGIGNCIRYDPRGKDYCIEQMTNKCGEMPRKE